MLVTSRVTVCSVSRVSLVNSELMMMSVESDEVSHVTCEVSPQYIWVGAAMGGSVSPVNVNKIK